MMSTIKFKGVPKAVYQVAYFLGKLVKSSVLAMQSLRNLEVTSVDFFTFFQKTLPGTAKDMLILFCLGIFVCIKYLGRRYSYLKHLSGCEINSLC